MENYINYLRNVMISFITFIMYAIIFIILSSNLIIFLNLLLKRLKKIIYLIYIFDENGKKEILIFIM